MISCGFVALERTSLWVSYGLEPQKWQRFDIGWRRLNRFATIRKFSDSRKFQVIQPAASQTQKWSRKFRKLRVKSSENYSKLVLWNSLEETILRRKKGHLDRLTCYINYKTISGLNRNFKTRWEWENLCIVFREKNCMKENSILMIM